MGGRGSNSGMSRSTESALRKLDVAWQNSGDTDLGRYAGPDGQKTVSPLIKGTPEQLQELRRVKSKLVDRHGVYYFESDEIVETKRVSVNNLHTEQPYVEHDATAKYIRQMSNGQVPSSPLGMRDTVVIKYGGNNWVIDGNHRMAAAKLLGINSVNVKFIDADAMGISGKRRR